MHTTKSRKLIGQVHTVETEFAVLDTVEGRTVEKTTEAPDFEQYDSGGRLLQEISGERMLVDQVYRDVYVYETDSGEPIEQQEYNEDGSLIGKYLFEPGPENGRIWKEYYVGADNELVLSSIRSFNDKGKLVEASHFDGHGNLLPKGPEYPVTKVVIRQLDEFTTEEQRFELDGSPGLKLVTVRDAKGNKTEFSCIDPDGTLGIKEVYDYEFDIVGNWTSKKTYRWVTGWGAFKLDPYTITRRKIVYYPS